eukprot:952494-Rhodomonas_salina.1
MTNCRIGERVARELANAIRSNGSLKSIRLDGNPLGSGASEVCRRGGRKRPERDGRCCVRGARSVERGERVEAWRLRVRGCVGAGRLRVCRGVCECRLRAKRHVRAALQTAKRHARVTLRV